MATPAPPPIAELRIERAAVRVVVTPEPRNGLAVAVRQAQGVPALSVRSAGRTVVVDGGLPGAGRPGRLDLLDRARCRADPRRLPLVVVRAPLNARITASGATFGEVGPARSLALTVTGCGAWRLAPVGRLEVHTESSSPAASVRINGPGRPVRAP